jgi:hypothetical protein
MDTKSNQMAATISSRNTIYPSIDTMLEPDILTGLVNRPVTSFRLAPFQPVGWSSTLSQFSGVYINEEERPFLLIKRITGHTDWVMRTTDDQHYRAISVWANGLLHRIPAEIDHAILGYAVEQDGYALLMRNVSNRLIANQAELSQTDWADILDALAALHTSFWEDAMLHNPALHLCNLIDLISHTSPSKIEPLLPDNLSPIVQVILDGWNKLPDLIGGELASQVIALSNDPRPLCAALAKYPQTLVHGDFHLANLGLERGVTPRLILLDWARPTFSAPGLDFAFLMGINGHKLPIPHDEAIDLYRQNLARRLGDHFDPCWWQPQLALSLLAGFAMTGCFQAVTLHKTKNADERKNLEEGLVWWCGRANGALKLLQSLQFM